MNQKDKINNLILNYFIQEGYKEAALTYAEELNISMGDVTHQSYLHNKPRVKMTLDYSTISQRQEIKYLILKGKIKEAILKISDYFPTILDSNNLLHFKLLRLNLVEMIRSHKVDQQADEKKFLNEILTFVRSNLINKVSNSYKLLKELEITMSLLCFKFDPQVTNLQEQKDLPDELKSLFKFSLRNQCFGLVNKAILDLYDEKGNERVFEGPKFIHLELDDTVRDVVAYEECDYEIDSEIVEEKDDKENEIEFPLETRLEKVIKLWTFTEQRLLDLNVTTEKRFSLNEGL